MNIVEIIHFIIGVYIYMLLFRMFVSERESNYNRLFKFIYKVTDPVMKPVHKTFRAGLRSTDKTDKTVFIPILLLVAIDGLTLGFLTPMISLAAGLSIRVLGFADYLFLAFVVLILVFSVFYKYARYPNNPFVKTAFKLMEPFYVAVGKAGRVFRDNSGVTLFIVALPLHVIASAILVPVAMGQMPGTTPLLVIGHSIMTLLMLANFFTYMIIFGAIASWAGLVRVNVNDPLIQLLKLMSEPINAPFRRIIPSIGRIDISPIFSILVLQIIARLGAQLVGAVFLPEAPGMAPMGGIPI